MILSSQLIFSDSQVVTSTGGSTNTVDLSATGTVLGAPAALARDIGKGEPIPVRVMLMAAATGTSPTLTVTIETDDNTGFSSPATVATATQKAGGAAGDRIDLYFLPQGTNQRYVRLKYTVGGTTPSYTISAFVPHGDQTNV